MFTTIVSCLLPLAALVPQGAGPKNNVTAIEGQRALSQMIQDDAFLSGADYLAPLKKRIRAESERAPILSAPIWSSNPGGKFIGRWGYDTEDNAFSYIAKSEKGDELFVIRGSFLQRRDGKWTAKITEASVTKLSNVFGPREAEKIKAGMSLGEVTKTLGVPPGAYFSGEVAFTYSGGGRHKSAFTGKSGEFVKSEPRFFSLLKGDKKDFHSKAWISNDLAIIVQFDPDGLVDWIDTDRVRCPYDYSKHLFRGLFPEKNGD